MTSINFNSSASSALKTLSNINKSLEQTQSAVSSGYKVGKAADNVAYWSISTTMNSDNKALNAASDALGVGAAKVDTAYAAMESAIDVVNEIKSKLVTANETSTDKEQIQLEITKLQEQLASIAQGASFSGENWMVTGTQTTGTVVDGFVRQDGAVSVTSATYSIENYALFDSVSGSTGSGGLLGDVMAITLDDTTDATALATHLTTVEDALADMTIAGGALGALSTRIDLQTDYAGQLSDAIEEGVSRLVDADMEEESAKLSALQTQQQLAIQSLSIANSSILTNVAANSALQTLSNINKGLEDTQNRVSSGYKVSQASDNVAYWSISTTMNSDNKALNAASDALGVGAAKVDTAYAAMESAIDVVNEIKAKLVTANETSTDKEQIQLEITKLQEQLSSIAQGASFSGENWMVAAGGTDPTTVVDGFIRNDDGTVAVTTATYDVDTYSLFDSVTGGTGSGGILGDVMGITLDDTTDATALAAHLTTVENALAQMTIGGAALGALTTRIDLQTDYAGQLSDAIEEGVSRLVDADMEQESAKLSALQTQQQLAIQSLSIANSSSQNIMTLFQ
eukprot:g25273.t1